MMATHEGSRSIYRRQVQILLFIGLLLLGGCGDDPTPTVTAVVTAMPLPQPTAPATPAALVSLLPEPTGAAAIVSPLTRTVAAPIRESASVTVAGVHTPLTGTGDQLTTTVVTTATTDTATEPCPIETDVALLTYPDTHMHLGCAVAAASFDPVAINEFGTGPEYDRFMLWFGSENQIYVLQPDKQWQVYADTWTEEQATFTCNPFTGEATSPPLPRRGFGKIWCTVEGLQATMGTIEREERLCQHTVTQPFDRGRLLACYEDATIRFFRIMDDGTWDQMLTQ